MLYSNRWWQGNILSFRNPHPDKLGFEIVKFPAQWTLHGLSAGHIRNSEMLKEGKPDLVIAFHNDLSSSKGTKNMVEKSMKANVKVICIDETTDYTDLVIEW